MNYAEEIKRLRKKHGITQQALADMVDIERYNLSKIENEERFVSEHLFIRLINSMGYELQKKIVRK
jgi:transcriptional regulator with XRE-family HTH domain